MKQLVSLVSYFEGFSALFLFAVAMPVKYIGGEPELVSIVGAVHGGLFVAFIALLFAGLGRHWTPTQKESVCLGRGGEWEFLLDWEDRCSDVMLV